MGDRSWEIDIKCEWCSEVLTTHYWNRSGAKLPDFDDETFRCVECNGETIISDITVALAYTIAPGKSSETYDLECEAARAFWKDEVFKLRRKYVGNIGLPPKVKCRLFGHAWEQLAYDGHRYPGGYNGPGKSIDGVFSICFNCGVVLDNLANEPFGCAFSPKPNNFTGFLGSPKYC